MGTSWAVINHGEIPVNEWVRSPRLLNRVMQPVAAVLGPGAGASWQCGCKVCAGSIQCGFAQPLRLPSMNMHDTSGALAS